MAADNSQQAELRLRLVIDDGTKETLDKLKEGMGQVESKTHDVHENVGEIAKGVFLGNAYWEATKKLIEGIEEGIKAVYEIAEKFVDAAIEASSEAQKQERGMAGLLHLMDQGEHTMAEVADYTKDVREELEASGLQSGVSAQQMTDMFDTVVERGRMSSEQAKELTEQMAQVGKVTRGGMQGLAEGFGMMELGIVRARNPLVQLIATTGVLHGNAKAVAMQLQHMTPEKQMAKAEEAIRKQAEMLKSGGGVPQTLDEFRTSFAGYREMFMQAVGDPIMKVLLPQLQRIQSWLGEHVEQIKAYGEEIGDWIAGVSEPIEAAVTGIYEALSENWSDIVKFAREAGKFVTDAFKSAFGDSKDIYAQFHDATQFMIDAFHEAAAIVKAIGETFQNIYEQIDTLGTATYGHASNVSNAQEASEAALKAADQLGPGTRAQFDEMIAVYARYATAAGESKDAIEAWTSAQQAHREQMERGGAELQDKVAANNVDYISDYINQAVQGANAGAQAFALQTLMGSETMMQSFKDGSIVINEGMQQLLKTVEENSPEIARAFKKMLEGVGRDKIKDIKPKFNMNFYGDIRINQDFKDQDPDRVAVIFRQDLAKHALARLDARTDTGFGGL